MGGGRYGAGVVLLLAAAAVAFHVAASSRLDSSRRRMQKWDCYTNLKTIAGALEIYELEKGTNARLEDVPLERLVKEGFLKSVPVCPYSSRAVDYLQDEDGVVYCRNHGSIIPVHGVDEHPDWTQYRWPALRRFLAEIGLY